MSDQIDKLNSLVLARKITWDAYLVACRVDDIHLASKLNVSLDALDLTINNSIANANTKLDQLYIEYMKAWQGLDDTAAELAKQAWMNYRNDAGLKYGETSINTYTAYRNVE